MTRNHEPLRILLRRRAIERRVGQMGRQISRDFAGRRVHLIGVLKGASIFLADLIRHVRLEASLDFISVSSYAHGTRSSGQVRLTKDLDTSIEGLNVILVEDILDTGLTVHYLRRVLRQRRPRVLRIAALLDKRQRGASEASRPTMSAFASPMNWSSAMASTMLGSTAICGTSACWRRLPSDAPAAAAVRGIKRPDSTWSPRK